MIWAYPYFRKPPSPQSSWLENAPGPRKLELCPGVQGPPAGSCLKWLVTNIGPDRLGTRLPHIQFDAFPTPFQKLPCKPGSDCSFRNQIEFYPHEKVQVYPHFPRGSLVNSPSASVLRTVLPHSRPTSSTRGPGGKTHRITNRTWGLNQQ